MFSLKEMSMPYTKYAVFAFVLSLGVMAPTASTSAGAKGLALAPASHGMQEPLLKNARVYCHWVTRCYHRARWSGRICRRVRICR